MCRQCVSIPPRLSTVDLDRERRETTERYQPATSSYRTNHNLALTCQEKPMFLAVGKYGFHFVLELKVHFIRLPPEPSEPLCHCRNSLLPLKSSARARPPLQVPASRYDVGLCFITSLHPTISDTCSRGDMIVVSLQVSKPIFP